MTGYCYLHRIFNSLGVEIKYEILSQNEIDFGETERKSKILGVFNKSRRRYYE